MIYLIHFHRRYKHAGHYLGFTPTLETLRSRLRDHRNGNGSRLMAVIALAGITWQLARVWRGEFADRTKERSMKTRSLDRYCPICTGTMRSVNNKISRKSKLHEDAPYGTI